VKAAKRAIEAEREKMAILKTFEVLELKRSRMLEKSPGLGIKGRGCG